MTSTKRKILIVEDDEIIANIYKNKFEKAGFEVEVTQDGQAGFYRVHELRPSVVLLDLMLPNMNGLDILKKMRAQKRFEKLPIFVFTNAFLSDIAQEAAEAGANRVFNKANTTPQQIVAAIESALSPRYVGSNAASIAPADDPAHTPVSPSPSFSQRGQRWEGNRDEGGSTEEGTSSKRSFSNEGDSEFQADLERAFFENAPETVSTLRRLFQKCPKSGDTRERLGNLQDLYRKVHSVTGSAAITGQRAISQMCGALEALLKELHEKPKNINVSTMRTIALAIDFLAFLFENPGKAEGGDHAPFNILVVDDEQISRRAVIYALEKANLKAVAVEDPKIANNLLKENNFDLAIFDVEMPGMDGFELCEELRKIPAHKHTPVLFVTCLSDFESRAKSTISGGNDFIGKPFLFMELAVKALTYVLRGRIQHRKVPATTEAQAEA